MRTPRSSGQYPGKRSSKKQKKKEEKEKKNLRHVVYVPQGRRLVKRVVEICYSISENAGAPCLHLNALHSPADGSWHSGTGRVGAGGYVGERRMVLVERYMGEVPEGANGIIFAELFAMSIVVPVPLSTNINHVSSDNFDAIRIVKKGFRLRGPYKELLSRMLISLQGAAETTVIHKRGDGCVHHICDELANIGAHWADGLTDWDEIQIMRRKCDAVFDMDFRADKRDEAILVIVRGLRDDLKARKAAKKSSPSATREAGQLEVLKRNLMNAWFDYFVHNSSARENLITLGWKRIALEMQALFNARQLCDEMFKLLEDENLQETFVCSLETMEELVLGLLFVTSMRFNFCGFLDNAEYLKISLPFSEINTLVPIPRWKFSAQKYIYIVQNTAKGQNAFWFTGFLEYKNAENFFEKLPLKCFRERS